MLLSQFLPVVCVQNMWNEISFLFDKQVDEDLTARISMADVRYSFQDSTKVQAPNWMSPESTILFSFHFIVDLQ